MNVLIVSQYFYPEGFQINELADSLTKKGVSVDVLTGKPNYPQGQIYDGYRALGCLEERMGQVSVFRVPLVPRRCGGLGLILNYLSFMLSALLLGPWLLRKKKYDAIFVYGTSPILQAVPALLLGKLKKTPVLLWVQDLWPESLSATGYVKNSFILKLVEKVVCWIYRKSDFLLVQSQAFIDEIGDMAGNTPIIYHPNSVEPIFSDPSPVSVPEISGLNAPFSILFAGNIGVAQSMGVILRAAIELKEYTDISFVIVGDGSARSGMLEEIERAGLNNVHMPGRYPVENMPGFMRQASVLLVSLTDEAIFAATVPNKIQAYMASGRPVLASLNGEGARLVKEADCGRAAPAEDHELLVKAILELYNMTCSERDRLGQNGRHFYEQNFEHSLLVDRLIDLFQGSHRKNK